MPPIATENGEALKRRRANGNNFSNQSPQIVVVLTVLPVRSCLIDGEAVVCRGTRIGEHLKMVLSIIDRHQER